LKKIREMGMNVIVTDYTAVTALGSSLEELWQGLLLGKTAIQPVQRFPSSHYRSNFAACIEGLSALGKGSMTHDLLNRLVPQIKDVPPDATLITATTKAGIDNLEKFKRGTPSDRNDILLSSIPESVSSTFGLKDVGFNVSAACASSSIAIARAAALIRHERVDAVFVCCIDLVTEFVFSGFSSLGALSASPAMPFDKNRSGLSLGEGAASILLMSETRARREGRPFLGRIAGWGISGDAFHLTAPARNGCGLIRAIRKALGMSQIGMEEINAICAHGTGTIHNDSMELAAFHSIFGTRKPSVYSVKGAIGHTLGAAGGIEVALGVRSLSEGLIPPTVGLTSPEEAAEGMVSSHLQEFGGDYLLTTNSGFGGVNSALILKRGISA
jgi:3-oxoacyl-[acyl-carrier-protein] synthase II